MTTSSGKGTQYGPQAVLEASAQVDLYDVDYGNFWEKGIAMLDIPETIVPYDATSKSQQVIDTIMSGEEPLQTDIDVVNRASEQANQYVYTTTKTLLDQGKKVALL